MEAENQPAIYLKNPIKSVLPGEVTGIGHTNVAIGQLLDSVSHSGDRGKRWLLPERMVDQEG